MKRFGIWYLTDILLESGHPFENLIEEFADLKFFLALISLIAIAIRMCLIVHTKRHSM